jgi:predicted ABC-type ATPase
LLVIAGPNGSGKTTVTVRLRADRWSEDVEYLNPDDVARDRFGDWNSPEATLEAARWTTARREALLAAHQGIVFETVFSTDDKLPGQGPQGTSCGCSSSARAIRGSTPLALLAASWRAGGIDIADRVYIYDNSEDGVEARLCARTTDGQLRKVYGPLPEWIADVTRDLPHHPQFVDLRGA